MVHVYYLVVSVICDTFEGLILIEREPEAYQQVNFVCTKREWQGKVVVYIVLIGI